MLKKWMILLLCLMGIVIFSGCNNSKDQGGSQDSSKLRVSVTFDAMKEFTEAVGGDKVDVSTIIPTGMEAHDFEPKAQDLAALSSAKVFVYNGLGMEGWVSDAISAANNSKLVIVEASKGANFIEVTENDHREDEEHGDEDKDHEEESHGKYDPHLWLSLREAQVEVKNIKEALVKADPGNKDYYEQNSTDYIAQLESLYEEYKGKFQTVTNKDFVTGHAAFGYLCRDFGLEQNSIKDLFAEGEPSAQQLTKLVEYCKEHHVNTIFSEEMVSPEIAQTLANEVGANVEVIYTIENAQDDMTYLERMESNLSKIYESLSK